MNQIEVTGMILLAGPIGENDRRVEILTKERGRISAFAKGARRQNSPLVSVANPFVFGTFTLYVGRNSYTLMSAKVENYFGELRSDIEGAYYGMYFLELASYFTREGNDETQMLKLLYQSLRALMKESIPKNLVRVIFEMKAMVVQGEGLEVFSCVACGKSEFDKNHDKPLFSIQRGGVVCGKCTGQQNTLDYIYPSESTLYAMQFITHATVEKLYTFNLQDGVFLELEKIIRDYYKFSVDKKFKTLEFLDLLT